MAVKALVENLDDVDESLRSHYTETTDDKTKKKVFVLDLEGDTNLLPVVKTVRNEAAGYRTQLREVTDKYGKIKGFEGMDHAEIQAKLDRIAELEAANGGKLDEKTIDGIVEGRIKTKLAPVERERDALKTERDTLKNEIEGFRTNDRQRKIGDAIRAAATAMKMTPEAFDDAIMYGERVFEVSEQGHVTVKDNVGFTPGIDAKTWLGDMQSKRPHWWGPSQGGGAQGGGKGGAGDGTNPWTAENWNITAQNKIYTTDQKKAERMAVAAGTKLGGTKPATKKS